MSKYCWADLQSAMNISSLREIIMINQLRSHLHVNHINRRWVMAIDLYLRISNCIFCSLYNSWSNCYVLNLQHLSAVFWFYRKLRVIPVLTFDWVKSIATVNTVKNRPAGSIFYSDLPLCFDWNEAKQEFFWKKSRQYKWVSEFVKISESEKHNGL